MSELDTSSTSRGTGVKTLGIRFQPALHTQMSVIAQLRSHSFQDEVIAASEAHVAQAKSDPQLLSRIQATLADIDRDAASRRDALAALFGTTEPQGTTPAPTTTAEPSTGQPEQPGGSGGRSRSRRGRSEDADS